MKRRTFGIDARAMSSDDYQAIRDLYERVWGRSRSDTYDRMRFLETMDGMPIAACAWSKEGELAGFFTLWPLELTDGRNTFSGGEAMDVMTDDRFRGKGVFPTLATKAAEMAAERGLKVLFGAPNEAIFATYLKRLAWSSPTSIRNYVRPLSLKNVAPMAGLAKPAFALWPRKQDRSTVIKTERPDDEALAACLKRDRPKRGKWRVVRSTEWYAFRYKEAGKFDYHWSCVWSEDELVAFAIWGLTIESDGKMRRANVADVVGKNALARQTAITAAAKQAQEAGANFLAASMTSTERAKEFTSNGFLPYSKSPLIAKTLGPDSFDANPFTEDGWDLFGADFDFF